MNLYSSMNRFPILGRFVIFVLIPLIMLLGALYWYLVLQNIPAKEKVLHHPELGSKVEIALDKFGIPTVSGKSDSDVFYATGYLHAKDRMWQLELQRRIVTGTLSEVVGESGISYDTMVLSMQLLSRARQSLDALSNEARHSLDMYTAGINSWIDSDPQLPVEFQVLGVKPEKWAPEHSLAWIKVFALSLSGNMDTELSLNVLAQHFQPELLANFYPQALVDSSLKDAPLNLVIDLKKKLDAFETKLKIGGDLVGSNAWVISGKHTKSGTPIIANDPHIGLQAPSSWYAINQYGNELHSSGMSMVGLPIVLFGKNQYVAWAGTNMGADTQDIVFEYTNSSSQRKDEVHSLKVKQFFPESIIKPFKQVQIKTRESQNGPIVSDIDGINGHSVALRWTALDSSDTSFEAFYRVNYAQNWEQFRAALAYHVAPAMNLLYADKNNIGFQATGKIPIRSADSEANAGWTQFVAFDELPRVLNPESGYFINSNNKIVDSEYPFYITHEWATDDRYDRIKTMIEKKVESDEPITVEYNTAMIHDLFDKEAKRFNQILWDNVESLQNNPVYQPYKNWDGYANGDSTAASIVYFTIHNLQKSIFADDLVKYENQKELNFILENLSSQVSLQRLNDILREESHYCDDTRTAIVESCNEVLESAFLKAERKLSKWWGSNPENWSWAGVQNIQLEHLPFSQIKGVDGLFELQNPNGGSPRTVDVAVSYYDKSEGFVQNFGASFRQIIQLGEKDISNHLIVNSSGQSGRVGSQNYRDMFETYSDKKLIELNGNPTTNWILLCPTTECIGKN